MRRLGYWLIGLIILSFVSNFFLPYAGLVSVLGYVVTIVLWLAYYGYFFFCILMAGKWYLEREQEKESGIERKPKSKRIKHKDKNGRNKPGAHTGQQRRRREVRHRYYTVPPHVVGRYKDE